MVRAQHASLFGEEPGPAPHPVKLNTYDLLREWARRFEAAHAGERYLFAAGKDARLLSQLARALGPPMLLLLLDDFFASRDRFIEEAGHTVGVFRSQVNKLAQARARRAGGPSLAAAAFDRLDEIDAARRAGR